MAKKVAQNVAARMKKVGQLAQKLRKEENLDRQDALDEANRRVR